MLDYRWKYVDPRQYMRFVPTTQLKEKARSVAPPLDVEAIATTCANCGKKLKSLKCKLVCDCGYYLSCADF